MMTDTALSPLARWTAPGIRDVSWTGGFWAQKTKLCAERMVPNMRALLEDPAVSHCWTNFRVAAGIEEGEHRGPPFHDGDFYKWLEAACFSLVDYPDPELRGFVDDAVSVIARVQEPSGYIFTKRAIEKAADPDAQSPLADELNFEVYNLGHLMTAACVHFRAFGTRKLLEVAEKAAGYLDSVFSSVSPDKAKTAVCPSHYMGLAELYRATGNRRWLELCRRLIALRDQVRNGTDDNQDRTPLLSQREAMGHAVRASYLYAGVADLYAESDAGVGAGVGAGIGAGYRDMLECVWNDVVFRKMYITGSCGALYDGVSPYGSSDYFSIQRTHQSFGRAYELPNVTAYNETCAAIGNYLWNWRMFLISGESRFLDVMEAVLYNGALAGISLDGTRYFYANALRRVRELPFSLKWSRQREPYISSFCCPPNLVRTIAETKAYAYAVSLPAAAPECRVLFYGSNSASLTMGNGTTVRLEQTGDYPWEGRISLRIAGIRGAAAFTISARIPAWAGAAPVRLNGSAIDAPVGEDGFIRVERSWSAGDLLELELPMDARLMEAHPLLEETRNQVAVMRGPLVYCLESADLGDGVSVFDVHLPRNASFRPTEMEVEGERVVGLNCTGFARQASGGTGGGPLYRPFVNTPPAPIPVRMVPYYAWDNRGFGEMSVWLPLA
ncbi:MAG TPA: ATP-binding protein [Treponema sp.]|nr:ATP-binding protein [Treponema sp.]